MKKEQENLPDDDGTERSGQGDRHGTASPAAGTIVRQVTLRLCLCSGMIALAVVLCRLLGFPPSGIWRVEFSFVPMAVIACLYGAPWSGICWGIADLIGAAIFTGINPLITLEKVLCGVVYGVCFHRRARVGWWRNLLANGVIALFLDFLMMSVIFRFMFGYTWGAAFAWRAGNAAVNLVIRTVTLAVCDRYLFGVLRKGRDTADV